MSEQIKKQLMADTKAAMISKNSGEVAFLRMISAEIKNQEIDKKSPLEAAETLQVLKKMIKKAKDAAEQYKQGSREDLAEKEEAQIQLCERYLPPAPSKEELTSVVEAVISELSANSMKDMGKVIKEVQERTQGTADNQTVSQLVKEKLS